MKPVNSAGNQGSCAPTSSESAVMFAMARSLKSRANSTEMLRSSTPAMAPSNSHINRRAASVSAIVVAIRISLV